MTQYQGDALWGACPDGGTIEFREGLVVRSGGLAGAVYISMMGGNQLDEGDPESLLQWWGNHLDTDENVHVRGRTGTLIAGIPMSSGNLARIVEAIESDLAWMITMGVATSIEASAGIEAARRIVLTVVVTAFDRTETFIFRQNWISGPTEPALTC